MTFKHLSENPRQQARAWNIALGVPGFRYADLNRVRRLEALDRAFLESLCGARTPGWPRPSRPGGRTEGSRNAVLFSIAAALKARGNRVVYFAGFKRAADLFKRRAIEDPCDVVVWSVDEGPLIPAHRRRDRTLLGNVGSINSPVQCMLKEVCSQCLQRQVDPATGHETLVFSCYNQDQPLHCVDFSFLSARLRQNSAAEKLTSLWLDHLFERREVQLV